MRAPVLVLLLAACAAVKADPSVPSADAPPAVIEAELNVVAVYANATCDTIDKAAMRGNGFYVNSRVVATVWHFYEHELPLFPDFAVVGPFGCHDAQYADMYPSEDILFLRTFKRHPGTGLPLADLAPAVGKTVYVYSFKSRRDSDGTGSSAVFGRYARKIVPLPAGAPKMENPPMFSASPAPRFGDSGSPALNARGEVVGMTVAIITDRRTGEKTGAHVSAFVIKKRLAGCGPCEED